MCVLVYVFFFNLFTYTVRVCHGVCAHRVCASCALLRPALRSTQKKMTNDVPNFRDREGSFQKKTASFLHD